MSDFILVADDELEVLDLLRLSFETQGHVVRAVNSGQKILDELSKDIPKLLVLDINMPVMDGYHLVERIRKNPDWHHIPVMMVSGLTKNSRRSDESWARALNVEAFVTKPFNPLELVRLAEKIMAKSDRKG